MSDKLKLSVIILAHRLDQRLKQALLSAQFAAEILLVNDLPADKQDQLKTWQKKYDFILLELEDKLTNFAQVRQKSLTAAHYDWVFFLDSDEHIEPTSINQIRAFIQQKRCAGALVQRQDLFLGQPLHYGEVSRVKLLRLAKKDCLSWQRAVHEVAQVEGQATTTNIKLWHQAHLSLREFVSDVTHYAQLEASYRQQQGKKFRLSQLIFYPPAKFIWNYFLRLGFLDGWRGLVYALIMSLHSLAVRAFQFELNHEN